jgi:hypothetical protein
VSRLRQAVFANEVLPYYVYDVTDGDQILGPRVEVAKFSLGTSPSSRFFKQVACHISLAGRLDAVLATFDVALSPSAMLSTHPTHPQTHWRNVVFPIIPSRLVRVAEMLEVELGFHGLGGWSFIPLQDTKPEL